MRLLMPDTSPDQAHLQRLFTELRPKLHRYCARMAGSVIDGEDLVQEVLMLAIEALPRVGTLANPEGWVFRVAHNAALDFLRRRARQNAASASEDLEMVSDSDPVEKDPLAAAASLRTFMRLPVSQRSSVILKDVLGYSLQEIAGIAESSLPAVKSALHRGRERLRGLAEEPDDRPRPSLTDAERKLLATYIERFNAGDFDAVREMLAEEVRLELVNRTRMKGRGEVSNYLSNYSRTRDWLYSAGFVDRRPAVLVRDPADPSGRPIYFVLLGWTGAEVATIRDFRYARYATDGAEFIPLV
jgi:RNA polymerase sigma-70 factor, ECF subfamily